MGKRFVPTSTMQRRMAAKDQRVQADLDRKRRRRYCELCDLWVPAAQTACRLCGAQTSKAAGT